MLKATCELKKKGSVVLGTTESVLKGSRELVELKKREKCVQKRGENWEN